MTFLSVNPPGQTYLLWHRFRMPTKHGSKDAVAVKSETADQLLSAYTFMLEHIVLLIWGITVIMLLLICIKIYERTHPSTAFHIEIYNKRSSPFSTLKAAVFYTIKTKSSTRPWLIFAWALLWTTLALAFIVVKYTVPIIFAPYIKIDNAAPVNPEAIFIPWYNQSDENGLLKVYTISVPWALRAAGRVGEVNNSSKKTHPVSVDDYEVLQVRSDGQKVVRLGYRYHVTGLDFGLQFYPDLALDVEGSCTTEYGWINSSGFASNSPDTFVEVYFPFNDESQQQKVSLFDGGPPMAYFFAQPPESDTNSSWAAIISSANRTSRWSGTDPWYLTEETSPGNFTVQAGRPALSCWQNDVWSYMGHNSSVVGLNSTSLPGLDLSPGLQSIFATSLAAPMIYQLGYYLRETSLKSSFSSLSNIFNASSSSMHDDLERLVVASYIATVNILTETTMFVNDNGTPNQLEVDGHLHDGASEFVIFTGEAVALSVRSLIIIPTLSLGLWVIFIILVLSPGKAVDSRFKLEKEVKSEPSETVETKTQEVPQSGLEKEMKDTGEAIGDSLIGKIADETAKVLNIGQNSTSNSIHEV